MKTKIVCILGLSFLLFASVIFADFTSPLFESRYIPDSNNVIATSGNVKITEKDLYLFLMINRRTPVNLYELYKNSTDDNEKKELENRIKSELQQLAVALQSDKIPEMKDFIQNIEWFYLRYMLYPVSEYVWIKNTIIDATPAKIIISPEDIKKYFNDNTAKEFYLPEGIKVRYIFKKGPGSEIEEARQKIKEMLQQIRDAADSEEKFSELAKKYSDAPSAINGGEIPMFRKGKMATDFEEVAFSLKPGQVSEVTEISEGFCIIYCKEKFPPKTVAVNEVEESIKNKLFLKFLKLQYDIDLEKLRTKYHPENDAHLWDYTENDAPILNINDLKISKKQMEILMQQSGVNIKPVDKNFLNYISNVVINQELIQQDLKKKEMNLTSLYQAAIPIAERIVAMNNYEKEVILPKIASDDETVKNYYNKNKEKLKNLISKTYIQIDARLKNPKGFTDTQLQAKVGGISILLDEFAMEMNRVIREKEILKEYDLTKPLSDEEKQKFLNAIESKVVKKVIKDYSKRMTDFRLEYKVFSNDILDESMTKYNTLNSFSPGELTDKQIFKDQSFGSMYYVISEDKSAYENFDRIKFYLREKIIRESTIQKREELKNNILGGNTIEYFLENKK